MTVIMQGETTNLISERISPKITVLKNFYVEKMNFYIVWAWKVRVTIDRALFD